MSAGHTPGPWAIDGCGSLGNLDVIYGSGRITMMDCENDEINDGELFANAALIAAAPDLLAALENMVAHWPHWASQIEVKQIDRDAIANARAALRKAGVA